MILDTNVLSELARPTPDARMSAWLREQPATQLATTTINVAEILAGIALLPEGARRDDIQSRMQRGLHALGARIHGFDQAAAAAYGPIIAARQRVGRPLRGFDGLIVAIAAARGLRIATRNVDDFGDCGVVIVNPWN